MHAWEAIQNAVDYIEGHLGEELDIGLLAGQAALSPFYFQRLFHRLVGCPVGEYTRLRRLAYAAGELAAGEKRVLDIALEAGFATQQGFTRAFGAAYGLTPTAYRNNPVELNHYARPELLLQYAIADENVPLIAGNIVLEVRREALAAPKHFLGFSRHVPIDGQVPPGKATGVSAPGAVWQLFHSGKSGFAGVKPRAEEWGFSYFGDAPEGYFTYFAGAEAAAGAKALPAQSAKLLGPGEYVVCAVEGETRAALVPGALDAALGYMLGTWLPSHGLSTQPYSAERYLGNNGGAEMLEIWLAPVPAPAE